MVSHTDTDGRVTIHPGTTVTMTTGIHPPGIHPIIIPPGTDPITDGVTIPTGQDTTMAFTTGTIRDITMTAIIPGTLYIMVQGGWLTTTAPLQWAEALGQRPARQEAAGLARLHLQVPAFLREPCQVQEGGQPLPDRP